MANQFEGKVALPPGSFDNDLEQPRRMPVKLIMHATHEQQHDTAGVLSAVPQARHDGDCRFLSQSDSIPSARRARAVNGLD